MGKVTKLCLGIALGLALGGAVFAQNLLLNPGFETWTAGPGGPPDNWYLSGGSIDATQEGTIVHGGTYSCNLTWTTTSTRYLIQDVPVTAGQSYVFSFWAFDNTPDGRARVAVRWFDGTGTYISGYYGDYTVDDPDWQFLSSGDQVAPAGAETAHVEIRVYDVSGWPGTATVYVDDASFEESGGPAPPDTVSIYDIQYTTDPSGDSPLEGEVVVTYGIVTAVCGSRFFFEEQPGGAWHGVMVYGYSGVAQGDSIMITAEVDEYYGMTELVNVQNVTVLGTDVDLPGPTPITTSQVNLEEYEGVLISVAYAMCTDPDLGYGEWEIDDGSGPCVVDDLCYAYTPTLGYFYDVTGPVNYSYGAYKIEPRYDSDVVEYPVDVAENGFSPSHCSLSVAPSVTSGTFEVRLALPETASGTISLYNASGRLVATFAKGDISEGLHTYTFSGDLENGVYFVKADLGAHSLMRTVVVMK